MFPTEGFEIRGFVFLEYHALGAGGDDHQAVISIIGKENVASFAENAKGTFSTQLPPEGQDLDQLSAAGRPNGQSRRATDVKTGMRGQRFIPFAFDSTSMEGFMQGVQLFRKRHGGSFPVICITNFD
jgi:hypothetical protein